VSEVEKLRRLVAHRELQLIRAGSVKSKGGRGWVTQRARKLAEAKAALERAEKRASDDPTPCPSCSSPTWDGLHRNGHRECDAWEAS
jgi:hypothetical protein